MNSSITKYRLRASKQTSYQFRTKTELFFCSCLWSRHSDDFHRQFFSNKITITATDRMTNKLEDQKFFVSFLMRVKVKQFWYSKYYVLLERISSKVRMLITRTSQVQTAHNWAFFTFEIREKLHARSEVGLRGSCYQKKSNKILLILSKGFAYAYVYVYVYMLYTSMFSFLFRRNLDNNFPYGINCRQTVDILHPSFIISVSIVQRF